MTWKSSPLLYRHALPWCLAITICALTAALENTGLLAQTIDKVPGHTAYLGVMINDESTGSVARFADRGGMLLTPIDELRDLGLQADPTVADAQGLVPLDRLPGVNWRHDPPCGACT